MAEQQPEVSIDTSQIPDVMPIMPLTDVALFPKMVLPLIVMETEYVKLVDAAMAKDRVLGFLAAYKAKDEGTYHPEELYDVGTSGLILKMGKSEDNRAQLMVQGLGRFRVQEFISGKPYLQARVEHIHEKEQKGKQVEALMANIQMLYARVIELSPVLPQELASMAKSIQDPGTLADVIASTINATLEQKQKVLETVDVKKRLKEVNKIINYQLEILELGNKIQSQVKGDMKQQQREYFLRKQIKAMQEELGEGDDDSNLEIEEYRTKIQEKDLPEMVFKEAERELKRLARMHPSSSEYTVSSTYLDWLTALPWNESTKDVLDVKKAQKVLDEDHYALEKAKKRIIEYLAVRKLKEDTKGPILCFVGPPGTGKTSLGRSIARAMGRQFIRISLGGVRDEAEIRGHRRTYVGALPGRIIQGIRRAESNNPIFMLDEIDKVGSDFRGDPSSALLEVLDPEQNFSFSDHYLDVPFDLSKVMFITTANILDTIPPALRDRMEVLHLTGYTEAEKVKIAFRHLIPRQLEAHGLDNSRLKFTRTAIRRIISDYTREAGLRNLEREIATICRGAASRIVGEGIQKISVKVADLKRYLGPIRFTSEVSSRIATPGVVMGLAWTQAGGDLLFVEATAMKGKGNLTLTGQLGDVMKESAQAALSFIRANAAALKISDDIFSQRDVHIHVPAGAIPKDGPSAGVTMMTALVSLFTDTPVRKDLAMTGEITLRGQVLPVGGIKEKVLAAHRAGVKTIILPKFNKKDLEDIPKHVMKTMQFHFTEKMTDVWQHARQPKNNRSNQP